MPTATLKTIQMVEKVLPIDTNILIFKTFPGTPATKLVKKLGSKGLLCMDFDKQSIRMVTHLDFTDEMLEEALRIIKKPKRLVPECSNAGLADQNGIDAAKKQLTLTLLDKFFPLIVWRIDC